MTAMRPLLYEVHTRQWLARLSDEQGRPIDLSTVPNAELERLAALGVTHLWLMGVWPTGPLARAQALGHPELRAAYDQALPGWTPQDVVGSPYAVAAFVVDPALGGDAGLARLRSRLAAAGIAIFLDFVPNHLGLDHSWLHTRPELFVAATHELTEAFEVAPSHRVAHGKDPYFPAWTDTLQLDYRRADTHRAMTEQLLAIAARCDGVRCDMAMLVLSDIFDKTWSHAPLAAEVERADEEFWPQAILAVRAAHPGFLFVAEAYWELEHRLCELGFDFAYDKTLYDRLLHDQPWDVQPHLLGLGEQVARRVHFLENHDEPRVAAQLDPPRHFAAAALMLALPGCALLHDGQLEGLRRFARIQLGRRAIEPSDDTGYQRYDQLLTAMAQTSVGRGQPALLAPQRAWPENPTAGCFTVVQWQRAEVDDAFDLVVVNLAPHRAQCRVVITARGVAGGSWLLTDLLGEERWQRDGDELCGPGLYLDLPAHTAQIFACTR
jgi:Alpha amylase, catalytic domain